MYEQAAVKTETQPLLPQKTESFTFRNNDYNDLLIQLEQKLNNILDRRGPEKQPVGGLEKKIPNDFISAFQDQIDRFQYNNERFSKLINHISEIM
jgi:hypothetical protein